MDGQRRDVAKGQSGFGMGFRIDELIPGNGWEERKTGG